MKYDIFLYPIILDNPWTMLQKSFIHFFYDFIILLKNFLFRFYWNNRVTYEMI